MIFSQTIRAVPAAAVETSLVILEQGSSLVNSSQALYIGQPLSRITFIWTTGVGCEGLKLVPDELRGPSFG